jgi:hypothetical protein
MSLLHLRLIGLVLVLASLFGAYTWVRHDAVSDYKVELMLEKAEDDKAQQDKLNTVSAELETLKAMRADNAKVVYKTVEKIVTRDVYRNDCIDSDGLSIANQALSGGSSTKPDAVVSAP